jgi:rod shape-determining protein MreC
MMPVQRRRLLSLLLVLSIVVLMSLTARERERLTWLEEQAVELLSPIQRSFSLAASRVQRAVDDLSELARAQAENDDLRRRLELLPPLEHELQELRSENNRLRQLLGFSETRPFPTVAARVVARNPDNWFSYAVLDKGARAGIERNMPVVTPEGLAGRIVRTSADTATILFLLDRDSGVAVGIYRTLPGTEAPVLKAFGVVLGQGEHGAVLRLRVFAHDVQIEPGDRVVTSGLGGVFPPGLLVGEVRQVETDAYELVTEAEVMPAVDFDRITEVLVVTDLVARLPP